MNKYLVDNSGHDRKDERTDIDGLQLSPEFTYDWRDKSYGLPMVDQPELSLTDDLNTHCSCV